MIVLNIQFHHIIVECYFFKHSSSSNISQCGIYYRSDWFLGRENQFYSVGVFAAEKKRRRRSCLNIVYKALANINSYAIKPVPPTHKPIRPKIDPTLGNITTAATWLHKSDEKQSRTRSILNRTKSS